MSFTAKYAGMINAVARSMPSVRRTQFRFEHGYDEAGGALMLFALPEGSESVYGMVLRDDGHYTLAQQLRPEAAARAREDFGTAEPLTS